MTVRTVRLHPVYAQSRPLVSFRGRRLTRGTPPADDDALFYNRCTCVLLTAMVCIAGVVTGVMYLANEEW